ncbi:MAG: hypothetical protein J6Y71_02395 [Ruminococcus sp.]|nr:hypothetical protein [Ruminococcus sp.]
MEEKAEKRRKTRLAKILSVATLLVSGIVLLGIFAIMMAHRQYDSFEEFRKKAYISFYVDVPENAEDIRYYSYDIVLGKYSIYAFTPDDQEYSKLLKEMTEKYDLEGKTEDKTGYRKWYLMKVRDANDPQYILDDFPTHLPFDKVIDDDINDYDIIVYSPMGSGSRSHGMVVKPDTRRVVVFNYGAR